MKNTFLYIIPVLIWGSTWLTIKFQLGVVDPMVSVGYRFLLAGIILLSFCKLRGLNLKYSAKEHFFMALLGFFLFGVNYWLVYIAELEITSGLVAIVFSTIVFLNSVNGAIFLKSKINIKVISGGILGIIGVGLLFKDELLLLNLSSTGLVALMYAFISAYLASLGNIISAYNQKIKLPVMQTNGFSMMYGSLLMFAIVLILGKNFTFDISFSYIASLSYLVIFGSIIAFGAYLTLVGKIGADKAANATLAIPIIAMIFSTIFEGYNWTLFSFIGVSLVFVGNFIALKKKK